MKNLIICADLLKSKLHGDVQVINITDKNALLKLDLSAFDKIIIGGSIHAGKVQSQLVRFCKTNLNQLQQKKIGFFLCTMEHPVKAEHYHHENFPGELIFGKMNFFEKFILQKIAKTKQDIFRIDTNHIDQFAEKMNA